MSLQRCICRYPYLPQGPDKCCTISRKGWGQYEDRHVSAVYYRKASLQLAYVHHVDFEEPGLHCNESWLEGVKGKKTKQGQQTAISRRIRMCFS